LVPWRCSVKSEKHMVDTAFVKTSPQLCTSIATSARRNVLLADAEGWGTLR
jgi:hypothetical protein